LLLLQLLGPLLLQLLGPLLLQLLLHHLYARAGQQVAAGLSV
jgi:hypothetical protein